jgi:adenylate kinase family enzyme
MGRKTLIFIAGAPGSGRSTLAAALQRKLRTPLFEFGWIPEFRFTGSRVTTYNEDEALAFENLVLVLQNYAKHDFEGVIVTDLENPRIAQLSKQFKSFDHIVITLRLLDDDLLKERVMDESRLSEYRDWEESQAINRGLFARKPFPNEIFVDIKDQSVGVLTDAIVALIQ